MFCSKCGKELKEGAKFCPQCGQEVGGTVVQEKTPEKAPAKNNIELNIPNVNMENVKSVTKIVASLGVALFNWGMFIAIALMVIFGDILVSDIRESYFNWGDPIPKELYCDTLFEAKDLNSYINEEVILELEEDFNNSRYEDYVDSDRYEDFQEMRTIFTKCELAVVFAFIFLVAGLMISFCALFSKYSTFEINRIGYILIVIGMAIVAFWIGSMNDFMELLVDGAVEYSTASTFKTVIILSIINVVIGVLYQKVNDVKKFSVSKETSQDTWRCPECNSVNPNYVGVCKCGRQKNEKKA